MGRVYAWDQPPFSSVIFSSTDNYYYKIIAALKWSIVNELKRNHKLFLPHLLKHFLPDLIIFLDPCNHF